MFQLDLQVLYSLKYWFDVVDKSTFIMDVDEFNEFDVTLDVSPMLAKMKKWIYIFILKSLTQILCMWHHFIKLCVSFKVIIQLTCYLCSL
jgi:hypothetical protein